MSEKHADPGPLRKAADSLTLPPNEKALRKAAKALVAQWESSGFYDRQDPALALALHEALDA